MKARAIGVSASHFFWMKSCPIALACCWIIATLLDLVGHIVLVRPCKKMGRIAAGGVVAAVEAMAFPFWKNPASEHEREPVGQVKSP